MEEELDAVLITLKTEKLQAPRGLDDKKIQQHTFPIMQRSLYTKYMKGCILLFLKKGDLEFTNNCRGITLDAIAADIYYILLLIVIQPETENIFRKNQNGF